VERLAENGLLFKTVWMNPESSSSHASIMSGQYPFRHKVFNSSRSSVAFKIENSWPYLLKQSNYKTAFSGAWPFANLAQLTPEKMGFESYCRLSRTGGLDFNGELKKVKDPVLGSCDFALDFIEQNKAKPFMLYYTIPFDAKKGMEASVRKMDECLGRIQLTLAKQGLQQKTIVIFTADGASSQAGSMNFKLSKLPSGIKRPGSLTASLNKLNNSGAQVPLVISAPFLIPKTGFYTRDLVDSSDFFSTIADLCGLRSSVTLDGRSFVSTLEGDLNPLKKRSWLFSQSSKGKMIRDWEYLYYNEKDFYGLKYDPLQNHNLHKTRHNDKKAPGGRDRLKMLMERVGS
jgi:arylsulfatase A-like enzyme